MSDPILVTGATGTQGNAVVRALLTRGYRVRALTRDPGKNAARALAGLGAELVRGDFADPATLRQAATGTSAVFTMGTPFEAGPHTETQQAITVLDAAAQAGTGHLIYTSVASALDHTGIPHFESKAEVERHLATLPLVWTVIAPVAFLENLHAPWSAPALAQGVYSSPLPGDRPLQQVAIADLADFAALAISDRDRFAGHRIELASIERTGQELAAALSRQLGRTVHYEESPQDSADDDMDKMAAFLRNTGYTVDIPALHTQYPQIGWHGLDDWIAEQYWSRPTHS
ncbi:MAG TPA: NmrA/HSCARG family protein [Pseudonocardiaceae bacterium]